MTEAKPVSASHTVMTELIMPNDTNPLGNLMGGNLMRWMDIAGSICASKHCNAHCVTVSVDHVTFRRPIKLGHAITIKAWATRAFNTSVEIFIEVETGSPTQSKTFLSNHAYYTFVALDQNTQRPTPIPKVLPVTDREKELYEGAARRRELRLVLSGRMQVEDAHEIQALFANIKHPRR
jgi:acyl-CoA hydrolase